MMTITGFSVNSAIAVTAKTASSRSQVLIDKDMAQPYQASQMHKLLIKEGQGANREIVLTPGLTRVGRDEGNDHVIDDPSVSRFHCEISLDGESLAVKDLGSANGTFIDRKPVQEARLFPGQQLRLGSIDLLCVRERVEQPPIPVHRTPQPGPVRVTATRTAAVQSEVAREVSVATVDDCREHAGTRADFTCQKCGSYFCRPCVKELRAGMRTFLCCPLCEGTCVPLEAQRQSAALERASFFALVSRAFGYPLKQDGLIVLIAGAVFFSLLEWGRNLASAAPLIGLVAIVILFITSVGYLFAFMRHVVVTTANGDDRPTWPEFTSFQESMVVPFFQFLAIALLCVGPGLAARIWISPAASLAVMAVGLFCMPMALLTVSMADSLGGLNPVVIFSSMAKAPGAYLLVGAVFALVLAVSGGLGMVIERIPVPLLPTLVLQFVTLYGIAVEMRTLGLFYRKYRDRLAWFS